MDFINWLENNFQWLVPTILAIANIVIVILKKAKIIKGDLPFETVIKALPCYINDAEKAYPVGNGKEKWKMVVMAAADCYRKASGKDLPDDFIENVNLAIEAILTTPQKKEGE